MFEVSSEIIPVPNCIGRGRKPIYPFGEMEIGQHFDAPDDMGKGKRQNSIGASCRKAGIKETGKKFATRKVGDVIRCWRVA